MFDDVADLYQDVILDRGRRPRHGTRPAMFDATARGDNPMCGDRVAVFVRYDESGRVADAGFEARGCAISVASADLMAEAVIGRSPDEIDGLTDRLEQMTRSGEIDDAPEALRALAGVHAYPSRVKCAMLPWQALRAALHGDKEASGE